MIDTRSNSATVLIDLNSWRDEMAVAQQAAETHQTILDYLMRIEGLEQEKARLAIAKMRAEKALESAKDEIAILKSRLEGGNTSVVPTNGHYTFTQFMLAVSQSLGRLDRWQSEFCEQTGTPMSNVQKWRKAGLVPETQYQMAKVLQPTSGQAKRTKWTDAEYHALDDLLASTPRPTYDDIAKQLTIKFNRKITENAIKGAVNRRAT